ncbi:MAG: glycoside hydrolase [Pseudomonadota bacterium]
MNRRELLLVVGASAVGAAISPTPAAAAAAAAAAGDDRTRWAAKAQALMPSLHETEQAPLQLVRATAADLPLRFRMDSDAPASELAKRVLHKGDSVVVDFGGHRTGYLSFRLETEGREPDAPARLRFTFGEVPTDVAEPLYPYKGQLSQAWLPDETVNIDYLPQSVRLARRYAFRYVKIEVLDTSPGFGVRFESLKAHAVTSARDMPPTLVTGTPLLRRIDEIALATLRDCMQTTFEDGPRRDQRLWIGDLRLQALTNYQTFRQNDVVQRCLYLFAALPRDDGLVSACVYEKPTARYGGLHIVDYAALFNVTLLDYVEATGDMETARDLWPVALRQLEILGRDVDADGRYRDPGNVWIFIDWARELDKNASIQAVLIYAWKATLQLARKIGRDGDVRDFPARIEKMTRAARANYWDAEKRVFLSGGKRQLSWASQAWMAIAGVSTKAESAAALRTAVGDSGAVKPVTPYLYHYVIEGMLAAGLKREARALLEKYWGGMVAAGADTFWEVYDPARPLSSPYGDIHINSFCHAWSCTPSYLLRSGRLT